MATINFATREITAKVVYFGASGAGCNTNVQRLFELLRARDKSKLHKFGPGDSDERSWYFDYVPDADAGINGFQICYRVYSLPGGLALPAHREEVLRNTDAFVFVADARPDREQTNLDSLLDLERVLSGLGLELAAVPLVLQVNHTDHDDARRPEEVVIDLNPYGFPVVPSCASEGEGVVETHLEVLGSVEARLRDNLAGNEATITLTAIHQADRERDVDVIRRHIEAIQEKTSSTPQSTIDGAPVAPEDLPEGPLVEVAFQPRDFVGSFPEQIVDAALDGDRVRLELVMRRMSGEEQRRLTVLLANRPTDTPPVPRPDPSPSAAPPGDRVFDYLPAAVDLEPAASDLPGLWYGVIGLSGGIVIGLLLGYLAGLVF